MRTPASFILGEVLLGMSMVEKGLDVLLDHRLNSIQCQAAVSITSKIPSCIKRGIDSRERGDTYFLCSLKH